MKEQERWDSILEESYAMAQAFKEKHGLGKAEVYRGKPDMPLIAIGRREVIFYEGMDLWSHSKNCMPHMVKPNATEEEALAWLRDGIKPGGEK